MRHFLRIATGLDVVPALVELHQQPELWDEFKERQEAPGTPHAAMSDIWLRYRPRDELVQPSAYIEPHIPAFYPAWGKLPALRPIVFGVMARCSAVQLGGVMITRIPPGGQILPHNDLGSWHAEFFNTKVYVPLQANDRCWNHCGGDLVQMAAGDAWIFNNLIEHSVENGGNADRITLIICLRTET